MGEEGASGSEPSFRLNWRKLQRVIGMNMLNTKDHFFLSEFFEIFEKQMQLLDNLRNEVASGSDSSGNIFEGCPRDLSFLRGEAIIIPRNELKSVSKPDHVILSFHPYYDRRFEHCLGLPSSLSSEKRIAVLFDLKDKWTRGELETYMTPFVDLSVKFDTYLMKNTRMIREPNPFDPAKEVAYYLKKF